jgi:quinol monooxygenase YgiN
MIACRLHTVRAAAEFALACCAGIDVASFGHGLVRLESTMTTISRSADLVTLIDVFTVEPARQQQLVDVLARATDETIRHMPGFVSANIHKSVDGARVTNYAQWRSRDDFDAMLRSPAAQPHLEEASALATTVDPHIYDVVAARADRRTRRQVALRAAATGALALGACAIGALAVGRLAIGVLSIKRGSLRKLSVEDLEIGRLAVRQFVVERE